MKSHFWFATRMWMSAFFILWASIRKGNYILFWIAFPFFCMCLYVSFCCITKCLDLFCSIFFNVFFTLTYSYMCLYVVDGEGAKHCFL